MSQVSLGRPEFVPGTPPGHPTAKFLYVIFLYWFFSLHKYGPGSLPVPFCRHGVDIVDAGIPWMYPPNLWGNDFSEIIHFVADLSLIK